mmetsp:Transcript_42384/g.76078  ORF Transcript_42384/g.76078 Transcript_42384/m.76078 type:complete len:245 (+) Transcript_42384:2537-3271(+)
MSANLAFSFFHDLLIHFFCFLFGAIPISRPAILPCCEIQPAAESKFSCAEAVFFFFFLRFGASTDKPVAWPLTRSPGATEPLDLALSRTEPRGLFALRAICMASSSLSDASSLSSSSSEPSSSMADDLVDLSSSSDSSSSSLESSSIESLVPNLSSLPACLSRLADELADLELGASLESCFGERPGERAGESSLSSLPDPLSEKSSLAASARSCFRFLSGSFPCSLCALFRSSCRASFSFRSLL